MLLAHRTKASRRRRPSSTRCCEHDLLESFALDVELDDGAQHRLAGFYTINEERLRRAGRAKRLASCTSDGYLQAIYMVDRLAVAISAT